MDNTNEQPELEKTLLQKPTFTSELVDECRKRKDFMPILFEWYKYVGGVCVTFACIDRKSPAIRKIPALNYAILIGLLNRCARLMLSNMCLATTHKYGETIMLLDRSIYESAITVQWLCKKDNIICFQEYLADGIKTDLKLKDDIERNIAERGGFMLAIEKGMLASIKEYLDSTDLSEKQIREMKPFPNLWTMCHDLGLPEKFYIATQRMGSHEVHGTWTALRGHYLKHAADGEYHARDHDVRPHENQFMALPLVVFDTLKQFFAYVVPNQLDRQPIEALISETREEMITLMQEIVSPDFEVET
jgi:hypothetical protein